MVVTREAAAPAAAVGPRSRVILVNSPHNPTGTVFTRAELEVVATVGQEHDLVRFAFCKSADRLDRAVRGLSRLPGAR